MFKGICGNNALGNVVLATTFWDKVTPDEGEERELELTDTDNLFKQLIIHGAKTIRHNRGTLSAKEMINYLVSKTAVKPHIFTQLDEGKTFSETDAGGILHEELKKMEERHAREMRQLHEEMAEAARMQNAALQEELNKDREDMQRQMARLEADRKKLEAKLSSNNKYRAARIAIGIVAAAAGMGGLFAAN